MGSEAQSREPKNRSLGDGGGSFKDLNFLNILCAHEIIHNDTRCFYAETNESCQLTYTGDDRVDIVSTILSDANIEVTVLSVYEDSLNYSIKWQQSS